MKRRRVESCLRVASLCLLVGVTNHCAQSDSGSRDGACDPSPAAVRAASERLIAADNARDLDAVLAGYTEDLVWLPPAGDVVSGKERIRPRYETLFADFEVEMSSDVIETGAEGALGFVRGVTRGSLTPLDGGPVVSVNDKFVALVRCEAGAWRVSHLMWSPRLEE